MSNSYWRAESARIIVEVRKKHPDAGGAALMDLLRAAYPFGPKQYWPYRVWRSEVRYQLGILPRWKHPKRPVRLEPVPPEQGSLF